MNLPTYTLAITATVDSSPLQNQRVTVRNERTGNTKFSNTNSNGRTIIDAASITGGVVPGDILTTFSVYLNYEGSTQHTVTAGGADITLTLTTTPSSDTLRYFTVQDYYDEMGYESTDSQIIKAVDVVKVGSDIESEIDELLSKRFDDTNSVTNEYHDVKDKYQDTFFLEKGPIQTLTGFWINEADEGSNFRWRNLAYVLLDDFDATTNWTGASEGSDTVTLSLNYTGDNINHGKTCMNVAKSGSDNATITFTRTNVASTNFNDKTLKLDIYTDDDDDLTATNAVEIRFGSDASNYYYKKWDKSSFGDTSWTTLSMHFEDTDCDVTGSPDITACDYFQVRVILAAASSTLTAGDIRLDHLRMEEEYLIEFDSETKRVKIGNSTNYPQKGKRQIRVDYTYGKTSVPREIKRLVILMTARHFMLTGISRTITSGREFTPSLNFLDKEIERIKAHHQIWDIRNT